MIRQSRFWIEVALIVLVALVAFLVGRTFPVTAPASDRISDVNSALEDSTGESATREEVPANTSVPGRGEETADGIASPETVTPAAPGVDSKKRSFKIDIQGDKFVPDTVIVSVGDIASMNFTAVDKSYDIVQPDYGFRLNISQSETKLLEAQFNNEGKYLFYCDSCGGPSVGPRGYLVVVP